MVFGRYVRSFGGKIVKTELHQNDHLLKMVFGSDLSSFGEKIVKTEFHQDDHLVKNDLTVQICRKRTFQPENVRFCKKWFLALI